MMLMRRVLRDSLKTGGLCRTGGRLMRGYRIDQKILDGKCLLTLFSREHYC